ncbi:MAG TPA: hypothetical protein VGG11_03855, partial [Xanthobacteraceae bacterium]
MTALKNYQRYATRCLEEARISDVAVTRHFLWRWVTLGRGSQIKKRASKAWWPTLFQSPTVEINCPPFSQRPS